MSSSVVLSATTAATVTSSSLVASSATPVTSSSVVASAIPTANINGTSNAEGGNTRADILVIARDSESAGKLASGFNGYGIPYSTLIVPQSGTELPTMNSSGVGNYGGILVHGQVSYDYGPELGFRSALQPEQWNQLYAYQTAYGARMVHLDVYPGPLFGANVVAGCCADREEQLMYFTDTDAFSQAGLNTNAPISTVGLYHYAATVADPATTTEIARFESNSQIASSYTAAVINNFDGRQQMVFFISWATDFSVTSNFLQHAYITWITRGLYAGYRRVTFNTQIDDLFLPTGIYKPANTQFRVRPADMAAHAAWVPTINGKLNPGSFYVPEIGHNGNGNIMQASIGSQGEAVCSPGPVYTEERADTELEFKKPLGSGSDAWPTTPTQFTYSNECLNRDPLKVWFSTPANRDQFAHMSHTYSHYELNNATYSDAAKEIQFNQAWLAAVGFEQGEYFSPKGLIPPAITGLHNGDVLRAWSDNGLTNCVGDNTRRPLRNPNNPMYPYYTTFAANGYDGFQVNPRWATRIYYNCDTADCTSSEWVETSTPRPSPGDFQNLLEVEKTDTMRHLFGLYHDGYMFHQANLRQIDLEPTVINGVSSKLSIFQAWVEVQVQEFIRLVNWPLVTEKHDDVSSSTFSDYKVSASDQFRLTIDVDVGWLRVPNCS